MSGEDLSAHDALIGEWDVVLVLDPSGRVRRHDLGTAGDETDLHVLVHPADVAAARAVLAAMAGGQRHERHATWRLRGDDGAWWTTEVLVVNLLAEPTVEAVVLAGRHVAADTAPAAELEPAAAPTRAAPGPDPLTVLVVDDHDANRALIRRILSRAGHRVVEAADTAGALALVEAAGGPPHVLLTDLVLPGASGSELAARLRAQTPDLPVVFVSGFGTMLERYGVRDELVVAKPFRADDLLMAVESALAA